MRSTLWVIWPYAAVIVPLMTLGLSFIDGGWFTVILIWFGWIWIPVAVVLALIPWIIMRVKRYHFDVPRPIAIAMVVHWVAFLVFPLAMTDTDDMDRIPAPLSVIFGERGAEILASVCFFLIPASYLVALIWAIALRSRRITDPAIYPALGSGS